MQSVLMLILLVVVTSSTGYGAQKRTAKIECQRNGQNSLYYLKAEMQFTEDYSKYGLARNSFAGDLIVYESASASPLSAKVEGSQIVPQRFSEPIFWSLFGALNWGELIRLELRGNSYQDDGEFFFGTFKRQNGPTYSATCRVEVIHPTDNGSRIPSGPRF